MSGSSFEELFGSFTIVDPATPKVPRATSGAGAATAAATDDPRVLETHFVAFGTDQESFDSEEQQETQFHALKIDFRKFELAQQKEIVTQILKVNSRTELLVSQQKSIDEALKNFKDPRPIWRDVARSCTSILTVLTALQSRYTSSSPTSPSVFAQVLNNRIRHIESVQQTANVAKQRNPTNAAGGSDMFDELLFAMAKEQNSQRVWKVDVGRVQRAEIARRNRAKKAGIKPIRGKFSALPDMWHALDVMGGGMGKITVYGKEDGRGRIVDRVVVKDTTSIGFDEEENWYGKGTEKVPIEFWVHKKLADTKCPHILGLASDEVQVDDAIATFRMFLEYASQGDLNELLGRHLEAGELLPEAFILYVFRALIETCLIMQRGKAGRVLDKSWEQIVHRDLKLDNVFLGENSITSFPAYPQVKLADFGIAIVTAPDDPANPSLYNRQTGTPGYLPPEQCAFSHPETGEAIDDFKLLSPCNVWGIGAIILCLLRNKKILSTEQPTYLPGGTWFYECDETARKTYSKELCSTVDRCLAYDPVHRPTLEQLEKWILDAIVADPWLAKQADIRSIGKGPMPYENRILEKTHKHYVGMAM